MFLNFTKDNGTEWSKPKKHEFQIKTRVCRTPQQLQLQLSSRCSNVHGIGSYVTGMILGIFPQHTAVKTGPLHYIRIQENAGNVKGWHVDTSQNLKERVTANNYFTLISCIITGLHACWMLLLQYKLVECPSFNILVTC